MKFLVTYWSQTGNTKMIAEAIFNALPLEKTLKHFDEVETLNGFDLTFIGFPVMQFGPPPPARKFIAAHASGKKIALFITHAMFSQSDDLLQQGMLEKELEKCRKTCAGANLIDMFHCQGELSKQTADELMASNIPMFMNFAGTRKFTIGHPNQEELEQAGEFALRVAAL